MRKINIGFRVILVVVCYIFCLHACIDEPRKQFNSLSSERTGVTFNNSIDDADSLHILNFEYIYNGGGVAIGDFNNDSLPDIFFTGNMVDNAIYLNKGDLKFHDISVESGISNFKRWSSGVTIVDINSDGYDDIYVCSTGHDLTADKSNLLFVNQGLNDDGIPVFEEKAEEYGITEKSNSTHAVFFDYDNDEDLDLFIIANEMPQDRSPSRYRSKVEDGSSNTTDHLYQNNWSDSLSHPIYTEVSEEAGIRYEGYSLGLNICDINQDGWEDIFVSNDYLSNDLFYINNQDGTFTNRADELFKHTSFSAMGTDIIDLDNDGDSDIITVDMLPEDNYRRKTMLSPNKYSDYANNKKYDFTFQFVRNTLQVNNAINGDIEKNYPFADLAFMSGISATDWSWTPLVADFDNDADRDVIITNGFPKDITDLDFINYSSSVKRFAEDQFILQKVPSVKLLNYAYQNEGDFKFKNVTEEWGITEPSFSNGAAYADLDRDGDLDYIVNNINDPASIFENENLSSNNWIDIRLKGPPQNPKGVGAQVHVYADSVHQILHHQATRGYLSSHELVSHFGIGDAQTIDSIIVQWSPGKISKLSSVEINKSISISHSSSSQESTKESLASDVFFKDLSETLGITYMHEELDIIDFNSQPLLLHKLSQYGPALSVGDVNGDNLDDLYISGSAGFPSTLYEQTKGGRFISVNKIKYANDDQKAREELGAVFFDADNDGDDDLYVVCGSNEYIPDSEKYQDMFFENDGTSLVYNDNALPPIKSSGLAIKAADYDGDGYIDLFIGGRIMPGQYPSADPSYILKNVSSNGGIKFEIDNKATNSALENIGMVTDALWTDYDNDSDLDLMIVAELQPVVILENLDGEFVKKVLSQEVGFWNSIAPGDIDNDGDIDYALGNLGLNILSQASADHPFRMYYKDFDNNGVKDLIPTCYFPDQNGEPQEFTYHGSLDLAKQYNEIKKKFVFHGEYAKAQMQDLFTKEQLDSCAIYTVDHLHTSMLINNGSSGFELIKLPEIVQRAPVYAMKFTDVNQDQYLDLLIVGNDYGMEVGIGRMDAHDGLVGLGDGTGNFSFKTGHSNGFLVQEDAKALVSLYNANRQSRIVMASQNQASLKTYETADVERIQVDKQDLYAVLFLKDGSTRKQEFYYGSSFLSQSGRHIYLNPSIDSVQMYNKDNMRASIKASIR